MDYDENTVYITQIGLNSAGLNGLALETNKIYKAYHDDILEILHTKHLHKIVFDPPPPPPSSSSLSLLISSNKRSSKVINNSDDDNSTELVEIKRPKIDKPKPVMKNSWEEIDNDKLLIFTAKGVVSSKKVIIFKIEVFFQQNTIFLIFAK